MYTCNSCGSVLSFCSSKIDIGCIYTARYEKTSYMFCDECGVEKKLESTPEYKEYKKRFDEWKASADYQKLIEQGKERIAKFKSNLNKDV